MQRNAFKAAFIWHMNRTLPQYTQQDLPQSISAQSFCCDLIATFCNGLLMVPWGLKQVALPGSSCFIVRKDSGLGVVTNGLSAWLTILIRYAILGLVTLNPRLSSCFTPNMWVFSWNISATWSIIVISFPSSSALLKPTLSPFFWHTWPVYVKPIVASPDCQVWAVRAWTWQYDAETPLKTPVSQ